MIIKVFSWGGRSQGRTILHVWPCLKPYYCQTTLVNSPNISGMLVTLPNVEKITANDVLAEQNASKGQKEGTN